MKNKRLHILGLKTELNKRNEMEERLRKYVLFFNQAKIGLVIGTTDGNLLEFMNPYFTEMHGYSVEELTGRPVADVFAPECRPELPRVTALIHEIGYYSYESKHVKKDGTVFPVLVTANTIYDEQKKAKYRLT